MRKTNTTPKKCWPPTGGKNGMEYVLFLKLRCPGSQTGWEDDFPFPKMGKVRCFLDGNPSTRDLRSSSINSLDGSGNLFEGYDWDFGCVSTCCALEF